MGLADASILKGEPEAIASPGLIRQFAARLETAWRRNEGSTVKAAHFPNEIDKSIGTRLRSRRMSVGLSQEQLAETLNLDPEDVSFFEQGLKRISAQQLLNIANALTVQPGYFFGVAGKSAEVSYAHKQPTAEPNARPALVEQGLRLQRAFFKLKDPALRESIVKLVNDMAKFSEAH